MSRTEDIPNPPARPAAGKLIYIAGAVFWLAACAAGAFAWQAWRASERDPSPASNSTNRSLPAPPPFREYDLPEFTLTECRGRTINRAKLLGRPAVICFVFTRCTGQCKRVDDQMRRMQELTASTKTRLITITVDPEHDTSEVLRRHAESLAADPRRWWFLTGEKKEIYRLIHDGFQLAVAQNTGKERTPGNEVAHSDAVLYVNASGRIVGKYSGSIASEMAELRRRIQKDDRNAAKPAGEGANRGG